MHSQYREYLINAFNRYVKDYDPSDPKIELKILHTYKVAQICDLIADSLNMSESDKTIAWTCGMLHDIGRFEQVRRYNTFVDSQSVDHANFGADLLFKEGLYEQMVMEDVADDQKSLVEKAIRAHSAFRIPEDLTQREKVFANLLRDSDKIDIFRVNYEYPIDVVFNMPLEDLKVASISDQVKKAFDEHRCVIRSERETAVDYVVAHISLVFELVYPKSIQIASERGYLFKILDFKSDNPDTQEFFCHMNKVVTEYVNSKIG